MDLEMDTWVIVAIVVGAVVLAALVAWLASRRSTQRASSDELRGRFGSEYDATVGRLGRRHGEDELRTRVQSFGDIELERIAPTEREELTEQWKQIQYRFLDEPNSSVREGEHLVAAIMHTRGFPAPDFDTRVRALSVEYPDLAEQYRSSYRSFRAVEDATASVEDMFSAMHGYRGLFEALIERPKREQRVEESPPPEHEPAM